MTGQDLLRQKEREFESSLRGKRLICEIPLAEGLIGELQNELEALGLNAWDDFPSVAAVTTVGVGVYHYQSGTYWDSWPGLDKANEAGRWGQRFERFLGAHPTLETFSFLRIERALRYVAPILAHGGVPLSCIHELFDLVARFGATGESGEELLEYLQSRAPTLGIHFVPVKRFIEYGGEVAEDLVGRLVALRDAYETDQAGFGLPPHILQAFRRWRQVHREAAATRGARFPAPTIKLDPGSYKLNLHLPPCDGHPDAGENWRFGDKCFPSSRGGDPILRKPRESWEVVNGERHFTFRGITKTSPALFFDPRTGQLIRGPEKRRLPERVWVITREGTTLSVQPEDEEEYKPWPGFRMVSLDLEGRTHLEVGGHLFEVRRPFFHGDMEPVLFVHSRDGLPVLNEPPRIWWEGKANLTVEFERKPQGNIDVEAGALAELLTDAGEYRLLLRGPLGDAQALHFLLAPGLRVEAKPNVRLPNGSSIDWHVTIPGGEVLLNGVPRAFMRSQERQPQADVVIRGRHLHLILTVPQLEWALSASREIEEAGEGRWSSACLSVPISQLRDDLFPHLIVRLPRLAQTEGMEISLVNGTRSEWLRSRPFTVRTDRIWRFDLRQARSWCETSGVVETLKIVVRAGSEIYRGAALEIRPEWDLDAETLRVSYSETESGCVTTWEWSESGPCSKGRWLTLEACWRPWEGTTVTRRLNPEERGRPPLQLAIPRLRPGRYLAKAIHAPWGLVDGVRPEPVAEKPVDVRKQEWPDVFSFTTKTEDIEQYLEALAAHWTKPELVRFGPPAPDNLGVEDLRTFLDYLLDVDRICQGIVPQGWNESLGIFWKNPDATLEATSALAEKPAIWEKVLPDESILSTEEIGKSERSFLREVILNYREFAGRCSSKGLQSPKLMRKWRRNFRRNNVPVLGNLLFLCERFDVVDGQSAFKTRTEYELLKRGHERMLGNYRRSGWQDNSTR